MFLSICWFSKIEFKYVFISRICLVENIRVKIWEFGKSSKISSEQFAKFTTPTYSCGAKCKSGARARLSSNSHESLGTTWVLVTKLTLKVFTSPDWKVSLFLRMKWTWLSSNWIWTSVSSKLNWKTKNDPFDNCISVPFVQYLIEYLGSPMGGTPYVAKVTHV